MPRGEPEGCDAHRAAFYGCHSCVGTYPLHLIAVNFEMFPNDMNSQPYTFYSMVLKYVLPHADPNILLKALLLLSSLSCHPDVGFSHEFQAKFFPLLKELSGEGSFVTCDAIWVMGQCCINMGRSIPPDVVVGFVTSLCERIAQTPRRVQSPVTVLSLGQLQLCTLGVSASSANPRFGK